MSNATIEAGDTLGDRGTRLYICDDCKQIIPLHSPGNIPYHHDVLLHKVEGDHGWRGHKFAVITVDKKGWEDPDRQRQIVAEIKAAAAGGETGLGSQFYDVKDQYHEDAMSCWKAHNRNPACSDFKHDSKRIMPDTAKDRREAGLGKYQSNLHICNFCPVASLVEQAVRAKRLK